MFLLNIYFLKKTLLLMLFLDGLFHYYSIVVPTTEKLEIRRSTSFRGKILTSFGQVETGNPSTQWMYIHTSTCTYSTCYACNLNVRRVLCGSRQLYHRQPGNVKVRNVYLTSPVYLGLIFLRNETVSGHFELFRSRFAGERLNRDTVAAAPPLFS